MKSDNSQKLRSGFTLLELVITIGIMAIMGTAVVMVLNPAETFRQTRDVNRIADVQNLNKALVFYQANGSSSFGSHNVIYVSLPSAMPDCSDLALPAAPLDWSYACQPVASYRNVDGTGWIPVDFTSTQGTVGTLFSSLPIDPINTVSGDYYYTYIYGTWTMSATLESVKYLASSATSDGGCISTRLEVGNDLALNCNVTAGGGLSSAKAITAFSFASPSATGVVTEGSHTVAITVPNGTNVTALVPTISISALSSVSPNTGVAQNFTSPVIYTVTAENSSTQDYAVTVSVAAPIQTCGNNIKEGSEVCDGTDLNSQSCSTQLGAGYTGTLSCNAGCSAFITSSCVAPPTAPTAPQSPLAGTANVRVPLSWTAPLSNGGSGITSYKVYRGTTIGSQTLLNTGNCSSLSNVLYCIDISVTNGTTYYYKISAVNSAGEGASSGVISVTPTDFRLVFITNSTTTGNIGGLSGADNFCQSAADTAHLGGSWKAWLSSSVTSASSRLEHSTVPYKLINGTTIVNNWTDLVDHSALQSPINKTEFNTAPGAGIHAFTYTDYDGNALTSGYSCADWTSASGGLTTVAGDITASYSWWTYYWGPACSTQQALYCFEQPSCSVDLPSASPRDLAGVSGNQQIILTWVAPYCTGTAITSYKVYRGTSSGGETLLSSGGCSALGNVLTCTDTGLTNGSTYYYKISAVNTAGESNLSPEISGTPYVPPSAPLNLAAVDEYSSGPAVILTWQAPSSSGSSAVANYKVYRGTSSGGETLLTTVGNVLTYTNTGAAEATTYYYKVSAVNSSGPMESTLSNEAFDTTKSWQNTSTDGNWNESCTSWLARTGQTGLASRSHYGSYAIDVPGYCAYDQYSAGVWSCYDDWATRTPDSITRPTYYCSSYLGNIYTQTFR